MKNVILWQNWKPDVHKSDITGLFYKKTLKDKNNKEYIFSIPILDGKYKEENGEYRDKFFDHKKRFFLLLIIILGFRNRKLLKRIFSCF